MAPHIRIYTAKYSKINQKECEATVERVETTIVTLLCPPTIPVQYWVPDSTRRGQWNKGTDKVASDTDHSRGY